MRFVSITLAALLAVVSLNARAASTQGTAKQKVITAISITNTSDLDFGTASQGASQKIVAAGTSENSDNGSFLVSGQANSSYTITLPADDTVNMTTGAGGSNQTIKVNGFNSYPSGTGTIGGGGSQNLYVGATRDAIGSAQVAGDYTGLYTVTVVY